MPLFLLGLTIGVTKNVAENKRELDILDERLRQAQNLVQDLHEEIEMKDLLLTVKEIDTDGPRIPKTGAHSFPDGTATTSSLVYETDNSWKSDMREPNDGAGEKSDAMREIEAELEAELERLKLNMKLTSVKNTSNFLEGDLRPEEANTHLEGTLKSDHDVIGSPGSQACSPNYAVSPQELSLRLHKLIESRLEERIVELEAALEASQQKQQFLLLENINCQSDSSGAIASTSSDQEKPMLPDETSKTDRQTLGSDLVGESPYAYKEARGDYRDKCIRCRHIVEHTEMVFRKTDQIS